MFYRLPLIPLALAASLSPAFGQTTEGLNPFEQAMPDSFDGLTRLPMMPSGRPDSLTAIYADDSQLRSATVSLYLPSNVIFSPDTTVAQVIAESLPMFTEEFRQAQDSRTTSPGGIEFTCRDGLTDGAQASSFCMGDLAGRVLQVRTDTQIDPAAETPPADVVEQGHALVGQFADLLQTVAGDQPAGAGSEAMADGPNPNDPPRLLHGRKDLSLTSALPRKIGDRTGILVSFPEVSGVIEYNYRKVGPAPYGRGEIYLLPGTTDTTDERIADIVAQISDAGVTVPEPQIITTAGGAELRCLDVVTQDELGSFVCFGEVHGRVYQYIMNEIIQPGLTDLPQELRDQNLQMASKIMDDLVAVPAEKEFEGVEIDTRMPKPEAFPQRIRNLQRSSLIMADEVQRLTVSYENSDATTMADFDAMFVGPDKAAAFDPEEAQASINRNFGAEGAYHDLSASDGQTATCKSLLDRDNRPLFICDGATGNALIGILIRGQEVEAGSPPPAGFTPYAQEVAVTLLESFSKYEANQE